VLYWGVLLIEYCTSSYLWCVYFKLKLFIGVWFYEDGGVSDSFDNFLLGCFLLRSPLKGDVFSGECCEWCGDDGEIFAEHSVIACYP